MAYSHYPALSDVGISVADDKSLKLDRKAIADAVTGEDSESAFISLNRFKEALSREADKTSINPLNYVDKIPIEYKDPKSTFSAPYASSQYSGLLVDMQL